MNFQSVSTKFVRGILTIWIIVTFTFIALNLSGDPIEALVGDQASPAVIAHYREKFGLDKTALGAIFFLSRQHHAGRFRSLVVGSETRA